MKMEVQNKPRLKGKVHWRRSSFFPVVMLSAVGILLTLSISSVENFMPNLRLNHAALHAVLETLGCMLALGIAAFLLMYRSERDKWYTVWLACSILVMGIIDIAINRADSAVKVSVSDRGPGIPEDELEAVFDKFVQSSKTKTGAGGTGLGLAICHEIICAHKGRIWAENKPEGGAMFSFEIPLSQDIDTRDQPLPVGAGIEATV